MLTAIEREFRAVDRERLADTLDRLARPLFGVTRLPTRERSLALAAAAYEALPADGSGPSSWLLSCALEDGRAAFLVLDGLAAAWQAAGEGDRARRAAGLRLLLPLSAGLRAAVHMDMARFKITR